MNEYLTDNSQTHICYIQQFYFSKHISIKSCNCLAVTLLSIIPGDHFVRKCKM